MAEQSRNHPHARGMARRLRREETPAEKALWGVLRKVEGPKWRRQSAIGPYVADFVCFAAKLVVEVDGGAHRATDVALRDAKKNTWLVEQGFEVLRFPNARALSDAPGLAAEISAAAAARLPAPPWGGAGGGGTHGSRENAAVSPGPSPEPTAAPPPLTPPHEGAGKRPSRRAHHQWSDTEPAQHDPATLILVGAIAGAFGVRGEVRVRCFTAAPEGVVSYGPLFDKDGRKILTPKRWRAVKDGLAVTGPEIATREAAEALRSVALYVPRDALPPADDEEFYHVDLIGCRVEGIDGAHLGDVFAVHDFGAGDVLELRTPEGDQRYIEFSRAEVPIVDIANRRLVATPIEGS